MNTKIGLRYYKFINDKDYEVIRILRIKNSNSFVVKNETTNSVIKITKDQLSEYIKLKSDGYITFNILALDDGVEDVLVSLHRTLDIFKGDNFPYACCRQNIYDLFSNLIKRENEETREWVGTSMTKDTCPPDVDFNIALACNSVLYTDIINIYRDDTLEDILSMISVYRFDKVLNTLYDKMKDSKMFVGYTKTLKEFLTINDFMSDFYRSYNIIKINSFEINFNGTSILEPEQIELLEDIIKYKMSNIYIIHYDRDIDMGAIQRDYITVSDSGNKLYIIAYDKGEYTNRPYDNMHDNTEKMYLLRNKYNGQIPK